MFLVIFTQPFFSQNIEVTVKDAETGTKIPDAKINPQKGSDLLDVFLTNSEGIGKKELGKGEGNYTFEVTKNGYRTTKADKYLKSGSNELVTQLIRIDYVHKLEDKYRDLVKDFKQDPNETSFNNIIDYLNETKKIFEFSNDSEMIEKFDRLENKMNRLHEKKIEKEFNDEINE
jgi:hypothetical protein